MCEQDGIEREETERFYFVFPDNKLPEQLRIFGEFAENPELNFTWHDAAVMAMRAKAMTPKEFGGYC